MKKIIIIEDSLELAQMIKKLLELRGFEALIANDAYQGVKMMWEYNPDLILLDIMLPAGGGWSVLEKIRGSPLAKAPVIVITAKEVDMDFRIKAKELNVTKIIPKPFDNDYLIETIKDMLRD